MHRPCFASGHPAQKTTVHLPPAPSFNPGQICHSSPSSHSSLFLPRMARPALKKGRRGRSRASPREQSEANTLQGAAARGQGLCWERAARGRGRGWWCGASTSSSADAGGAPLGRRRGAVLSPAARSFPLPSTTRRRRGQASNVEIAIGKGRFFGRTGADGREAAADFRPIAVARSPKALNFFISLLLLGCLSRPSDRAKIKDAPAADRDKHSRRGWLWIVSSGGGWFAFPFFAAIGLLKITSLVQLLIRPDCQELVMFLHVSVAFGTNTRCGGHGGQRLTGHASTRTCSNQSCQSLKS
jgi:hypothetical protein